MKGVIDMALDRGKFIDQSQILNLLMSNSTVEKSNTMHFYDFKTGLKTDVCYSRAIHVANSGQHAVLQDDHNYKSKGDETNGNNCYSPRNFFLNFTFAQIFLLISS